MKLEEYLTALKNCPNNKVLHKVRDNEIEISKLTAELGIYDNWPIFFKEEFNKINNYLKESDKFKLEYIKEHKDGPFSYYSYIPGTVNAQVLGWIPEAFCGGTEQDKAKQAKEYCSAITLHWQQIKEMKNVDPARALATAASDILKYAQKNKMNICLPKSRGWNNLNDYSQIIYHSPK